ncbi:hypothetical protein FDK21_17500 [Cohaesibacter sp. CAU 1516]|nr:hypothetical protein FDK21_17500 [Cohaesibacter sp. CAU 1516]
MQGSSCAMNAPCPQEPIIDMSVQQGLRHLEYKVTTTDSFTGETKAYETKAIINAAGPWVSDVINNVANSKSKRNIRLVKGSHIIVPNFWTGAQAYVMPVPFFANTSDDREILLAQRGVNEVFELAESAPLKIVGIGTVDTDTQLVASGMIEQSEIAEIAKSGAIGELLGHFFDQDGNILETPLTSRTVSVSRNSMTNSKIVAIAGGDQKVDAIRAILNSRNLSGLITDERTARALLA